MGLGSEVSLGVALGSLGVCGVHVRFYKFIVVGSKSMPRGVSPKVGCGDDGSFSVNTSI